MFAAGLVALGLVVAQAQPTSTEATEATEAERAAAAAERAAEAAERAAEAIARSAAAVEALVKAREEARDEAPPEAAPAPAPAEKAEKEKAARVWTGTVGLAVISLTGNTSTLTLSGNASATRKWEGWALGLKAFGTYGQTRPPEEAATQVTAMVAGAQFRGDRSATKAVSVFVALGGEMNHVKSIEFLGYAEGGAGIVWLERKEADLLKVLLRTDLGIRYARELQYQYYPEPMDLPDRNILGPRANVAFRYALSKDVIFSEEAEALPTLIGPGRVLVNSTTKLSSRLVGSVSLSVGFVVNYDSLPAMGKVPTDTSLTIGVDVGL